ncbi:MAG TPA: serine protease [Roseiflexaceae bacterium]|nr:serine protease [Roseiflexaceae bacterium]
MSDVFSRYRWWLALMVTLLLVGSFSPQLRSASAQASQLDDEEYEKAELATAQIYIVDPDGKPMGTCTGTFQTPDGIILTNFHCVGHTDLYGEDDTGLGLSHGDFYHPQGLVVIAPTKNDREVPKPTYVAQVRAANPDLDIAVVQIVGMLKEGQKLPAKLPIVPIERGDSDNVKSRDFVAVLGYPGVGGPLLTYTEGQIAGFEDQNGDDEIDSFKTTANINPGNSGGLAVNADGQQIGIPTYGVSEGASKIDRIKMINVAEPYIQQAIEGGTAPTPSNPGTTKPDQPTSDGVILKGMIVDANTKKGVPGALMIVLQPGVTADQFEESGFSEDLVATIGTADRSGAYQTTPALPRGQTYTVIVGAKGYQPRAFEDGLEITEDDPDITKIDTIAIQKR